MSQLHKVRKSQALLLSLFYYPNQWLVCSRLLYGSSWLFRLQPIPFSIFPYIVGLISPSFCLSSFSAFLLQHRGSSLWWMSWDWHTSQTTNQMCSEPSLCKEKCFSSAIKYVILVKRVTEASLYGNSITLSFSSIIFQKVTLHNCIINSVPARPFG